MFKITSIGIKPPALSTLSDEQLQEMLVDDIDSEDYEACSIYRDELNRRLNLRGKHPVSTVIPTED